MQISLQGIPQAEQPMLVVNSQGLVVAVSQAFTKAYGWKERDLLGNPLTLIIPPPLRDAHHLGFARFMATNEATLLETPLELSILSVDGRVLTARHYIWQADEGGERYFFATITPVEDDSAPNQ